MKGRINVKLEAVNKIYMTLCFILLLSNIVFLTIEYMKYKTDTQVAFFVPKKLNAPKTSLCFNIETLVKGSIRTKWFDEDIDILLNKTLGELFSKSPPPNEVLQGCSYRNFTSKELIKVENDTECTRIFHVKRFRMQTNVCYLFDIKDPKLFTVYTTMLALQRPGLLFSFTIKSPLNQGHTLIPFAHLDDLPNDERIYNLELTPSAEGKQMFQLAFDTYKLTRLPSPYDTKCKNVTRLHCLCNCANKLSAKLGLIPLYSIDEDSTHLNHLRIPDLRNETILIAQNNIENKCKLSCPYEACHQTLVRTLVSIPYPTRSKLKFEVMLDNMSFGTIYLPKVNFSDYFERCLNLIGIWVEISVLSLLLIGKSEDSKQLGEKIKIVQVKFNWIMSNPRTNRIVVKKTKQVQMINWRQICCLIMRTLIYFAFSWQILNVFSSYFTYKTIVKHTYSIDPSLSMPSIAFCIHVEDLLNSEYIYQDYEETNYDKLLVKKGKVYDNDLDTIYNLTWKEEILFKCRLRNLTHPLSKLVLLPLEECLKHFTIKKFHVRHQMCYDFLPNNIQLDLDQTDVGFMPINPGTLYSLILNPKVSKYWLLRIIVHFGHDTPVESIKFFSHSWLASEPRTQILTYFLRKIIKLPSPYDTNCHPTIYKQECIDKCLMKMKDDMNRLPYGTIIDQPYPVKILTYNDMKNKTIKSYWRNLEKICFSSCRQENCDMNFTQTYISDRLNIFEFDGEFIVNLHHYPTETSVFYPRTTFYDLYYQFFSCLAFWIGVSMFSFNPLTFKSRLMKKQLETRLKKVEMVVDECRKLITNMIRDSFWEKAMNQITHSGGRKIIVSLICFIGCTVHISTTFIKYFQYHSIISVEPLVESSTNYDFIICLWYSELIKQNHTDNLTIAEIISLTPKNESMIVGCGYWGLHKRMVNNLTVLSDRVFFTVDNKPLCESLYRVEKFVIPGRICYRTINKKVLSWDNFQMSNTFSINNPLKAIVVNNTFLNSYYKIAIVRQGENSISAIAWAPTIVKKNMNTFYNAEYFRYESKLLPAPYSDEGFTNTHIPICMLICVDKYLAKSNLSYTGVFKEPSNLKYITPTMRSNHQLDDRLKKYQRKCDVTCAENKYLTKTKNYLVTALTDTFVDDGTESVRMRDKVNMKTAFYVHSTSSPVLQVTYDPRMSLFELIVEIGGIISIWFGISVIQINLFERKKAITLSNIDSLVLKLNFLMKNIRL